MISIALERKLGICRLSWPVRKQGSSSSSETIATSVVVYKLTDRDKVAKPYNGFCPVPVDKPVFIVSPSRANLVVDLHTTQWYPYMSDKHGGTNQQVNRPLNARSREC